MRNILIGVVALSIILGGYWVFANKAPVQDGMVNRSPVTSGEGAEEGDPVHGLPAEPAAVEARKDLAAKLGVDEKKIVILLVEEKTWSDGCLGLGGPAESCLFALVDGFRVELLAEGKTYVYRTDKTGASVRAETK